MLKYKQIKVNVTPEHHHQLLQLADDKNMTLAQHVRSELNIDLKEKPRIRKKRTDSSVYNKADPKLIYHLAKIGSNINQIAKKLNKGDTLHLATLIDIRKALNDYISQ